jgi:hypothetical protein
MKFYTLHKSKPAVRVKPISDAGHARDAECPDGGWKPLTHEQKARLSILAREAAIAQGRSLKKQDLDEFRHELAIHACKRRISEATQSDWADLKSAFQDAAGKPEAAFRTQMREGDNKRRVAMHKLTTALAAKGLAPAYAGSICRAQFKCPLEEATAKQIWCLFYTVQNRRK